MRIKYSAVPTNLTVGTRAVNRLVVQHNGKTGKSTFEERVAKRCGYDKSVVTCVNDGCGSQLCEELSNGNRVDLGWSYAMLTAQGSSESTREPWNPAKNRLAASFIAKDPVKTCLEGVELVNVTAGAKVMILHVSDSVAVIDGTISGTSDVDVRITGNGLALDIAAADEGVWLEDAKGVIQAVATVTETATTSLACRFATLPEDGTYTLVVASRNGLGADYGVAMGRRKVNVCAEA